MSSKLCPFCMRMAETDTCPHCGKNINYAGMPMHLPAGYVVSGKHPYVLGAALGQGGFGITYIALDMVTNERVAIKEYFPTYCSGRTNNSTVSAYQNQEDIYLKGKERFLDEARTLKSLSDLKSIVNVLDFFEANNSAYLVMEFLEGSSLKGHVAQNGKFPAQKFLGQIQPLMEDIERMHQRGVVHRDIAPDNIILLPDGQMKLIDFGAARSFVGDRSMTVVVKKGFAPLEQYLTKGTTPSTDVYALAATIYYCITGTVPMDSAERQYDGTPLESPSALGADITPLQEKALAKALEIQQKVRTQSVQEFLDNLNKEPEKPKTEPVKPESPITKPESAEQKPDPVSTLPVEEEAAPVYTEPVKQKEPAHTIPEEQPKPETEPKTKKKKPVWIAAAAAILAVVVLVGFFAARLGNGTAQTTTTGEAVTMLAPNLNILRSDVVVLEDLGNGKYARRPVFGKQIMRDQIASITFLSTKESAPDDAWDVSQARNRSVVAWIEENGTLYDMYIAGEGGVTAPSNCETLFALYSNAKYINFNNSFSTANVTNMHDMFLQCQSLKELDLRGFNTSSTTSMSAMFHLCSDLQELDLSSFATSKVTEMGWMFAECSDLTDISLSGFDTKKVKDMGCMFYCCDSLTSLDLGNWDTSNVTDMNGMFMYCTRLTSLDVSRWDTSNVSDMDGMFYCCDSLTSLDLGNWDTSKVEMYDNFMDSGKTVNGQPWEVLFEK